MSVDSFSAPTSRNEEPARIASQLIETYGYPGALYVASEICLSLDFEALDAVRRILDLVGKPAFLVDYFHEAEKQVKHPRMAILIVKAICAKAEKIDRRSVISVARDVDAAILRNRG